MKDIKNVSEIINEPQNDIKKHLKCLELEGITFYKDSIHKVEDTIIAMARNNSEKFLMLFSETSNGAIDKFTGETLGSAGVYAKMAGLNEENAEIIRTLFPWTKPISLKNHSTTIGCGDRLGLATAGHISAIRDFRGAKPVLAQQSIRELALTGRNYRQVVDDAVFGVFQSGYKNGYGADGDHLKTMDDISIALDADMPMITLDLSDVLNVGAADLSDPEIRTLFEKLPTTLKERVLSSYSGKTFEVSSDNALKLDEITIMRCVIMYNEAMDFAAKVDDYLKSRRGNEYDLEISIDETSAPTLPTHHLYIINELLYRSVKPASVAPRFIGEFQKGIDYIGDVSEFEKQFKVHCQIAKKYGNYKVSVHSGSDKFSIFPIVGKETGGYLHLKTAGTSWLEALRLISIHSPFLFKTIYKRARRTFNEALKLYHISTTIDQTPDIDDIEQTAFPELLNQVPARQLLHITYGSILNTPSIRPLFFASMHTNEDGYYDLLRTHFDKHLSTLGVKPV
jgi:tagaturonate epimerase